jgi:hypothetical protein
MASAGPCISPPKTQAGSLRDQQLLAAAGGTAVEGKGQEMGAGERNLGNATPISGESPHLPSREGVPMGWDRVMGTRVPD